MQLSYRYVYVLFATEAANIKIEKTDRQTDNYVQRLQKRKQREKQLQTRHSNTGKLTENNFKQRTSNVRLYMLAVLT